MTKQNLGKIIYKQVFMVGWRVQKNFSLSHRTNSTAASPSLRLPLATHIGGTDVNKHPHDALLHVISNLAS